MKSITLVAVCKIHPSARWGGRPSWGEVGFIDEGKSDGYD
jgi:hypothetical protein